MNSKNRIISVILILAMAAALVPYAMFGETFDYEGMPDGNDIIKNASYTDIRNDSNIDSIYKMSVYSVVREYGNTAYRPNANATREDMLASIVRAIGRQNQAIQQGDAIKAANPSLSTTEAYIRGHMEVAKSSGLITAAEVTTLSELSASDISAIEAEVNKAVKENWKITTAEKNKLLQDKKDERAYQKAFKSAANREEAAIWIARALSLQPISGESTMSVYNYTDWKSLKTESLPIVEAVLRSGVMKSASSTRLSPKGTITKSEMASIMDNMTAKTLADLGYTVGYGKVIKAEQRRNATAFGDTNITEIVIETPNGDTVNITNNNKTQSVPVIKSSRLGNQSLIAKDDIVEYTINKDKRALLLHVGKFRELSGTFEGYSQQKGEAYLADADFRSYTMKVQPDTLVKAEGVPVDITKVQAGTPMKAIYSGNTLRSIELQASPETINTKEINAKIIFADTIGNVVKIIDENDNRRYMNLSEGAFIYVNDYPSSIDAIGFDQDAILKISDNKIMEVRIYTDVPFEEKERDIVFTGRVREVVGDNLILTKDVGPEEQSTYIINDKTSIYKDNQIVARSRIKQGDRVKAYVNAEQDDFITKLELQGEGLLMKNLYKADIKDVLTHTGELVLSNVYTYGYYDWEKVSDYMKVKIASQPKIFRNSSELKLSDLKKHLGKTMYAASKENYGDEELVHVVLKEGYEDTLYKKIDDIKWTANEMKLSDGRLINYLEGSIVIKDGRLLDTDDLAEDVGAFIIQNKSFTGIGTAPVISLDSFNGFLDYRISKGYLHKMGEDYYTIENSYRMTNNSWDKWAELTYYFSSDTYIFDSVVTDGTITAKKFAESRFKPYTYTWPNYSTAGYGSEFHTTDQYHTNYKLKNTANYHEHCLLYTITDAYGNSQAVNIFKKDKESYNPLYTHNERMITGKISSINLDNMMLSLKQVMDYSSVYEQWQPVKAEVPLDLERVIIIKDDKVIQPKDLTKDDNIYVLANDGYAIFMIVQ